MGFTYEQLIAAGAKPVTTGTSPTEPKKKFTYEELIAAGAKPGKKQPVVEGQQKYAIPPIQESQEKKIQRYKADAAKYAEEERKAKSFGGFAKNFGKAFVENIAPSEVGLGKTIAAIGTDPSVYVEAHNSLIDSNLKLKKLIEAKEARGEDVTNLKRAYNSNADLASEHAKTIQEITGALPTGMQAVGQIGGTALDILTAGSYGKGAQALQTGKLGKAKPIVVEAVQTLAKPKGIITKKGASTIAKSTGVGYAYDVTQGLQGNRGEDRMGAKALIPGTGTLVAGLIPTALEGYASGVGKFGKNARIQRIVDKRAQEIDQIESNYAGIRKLTAGNKGDEAKRILASTDLLHGAVDPDGTIRTEAAISELNAFLKPQEDVVYKNLVAEGKRIPLSVVEKRLKSAVNSSGVKGGARLRALKNVEDDIAGYALDADKNGTIPVAEIHNAKVDKYANINYLNPESKKIDKVIAKELKKIVENETKSVDVQKVNEELSKYYAVQKLLEKLDGKKVKGGKLGKYFAQTVGAIVGSHFGPLGAIAGSEIGGAIKGASMSSRFSGKTGNKLMQSDIIKNALKSAETRTLPVRSLPSEYTNELPTIPFGKKPKLKGQQPMGGLPVIEY